MLLSGTTWVSVCPALLFTMCGRPRLVVQGTSKGRTIIYILLYVDDILVIHHDSMPVLKDIDDYMKLKLTSTADPEMYLGAKLSKVQLSNGTWAWLISPSKYVQEAVKNFRGFLKNNCDGGYKLICYAPNSFQLGYEPGMDTSPLLPPNEASYFQTIIGVIQWMVKFGRIDIATEVLLLSSFLAMTRQCHLLNVLHIMARLKDKHNSILVLDSTYPKINEDHFKAEEDWKQLCGDVKEDILSNAPKPLGYEVVLQMFADDDHAGEKVTSRSRSGFMILMNMGMIQWHSKQQATAVSAVFGSEFVCLKQGVECLKRIRDKLRNERQWRSMNASHTGCRP